MSKSPASLFVVSVPVHRAAMSAGVHLEITPYTPALLNKTDRVVSPKEGMA
jgi:hypothetical protein